MVRKSTPAMGESRTTRSATARSNGTASQIPVSANTRSQKAASPAMTRSATARANDTASRIPVPANTRNQKAVSSAMTRSATSRANSTTSKIPVPANTYTQSVNGSHRRYSDSSSELSSPPPSSQSPSEGESAQSLLKAPRKVTNKKTQAIPNARKSQSKVVAKPHKSPLLLEEEQDELEESRHKKKIAANVAKTKRYADQKIQRETEKQRKFRELEALVQQDRLAPAPWTLQLPALPPRPNLTNRILPLKMLNNDDTFPLTAASREGVVALILDAMRDVRQAEDTVSSTTDFRYMWLKPSLEGTFSYNEVDMERVCRKIVSIAEGLHIHGLGATEIYCPRTIQKAQDAKAISFKERVDKLALLMRKSKARCNAFMMNNTMEDTIALIDLKLSDQRSNAANNNARSLKLNTSNNLLGMQKGAIWPKDENGVPMIPTWDNQTHQYGTPASMDTGVLGEDRAGDDRPQHINDLQIPTLNDPTLQYGTPASMGAGVSNDRQANGDPPQHADDLQAQSQLLPWLSEYEKYAPSGQWLPAQTNPGPSQPSNFGLDNTLGSSSHTEETFLGDVLPFDEFIFEEMFTHNNGVPALPDQGEISKRRSLNSEVEDDTAEAPHPKRPRHERPEELTVNSLLRGKTAKPSAKSSSTVRR
ncbi:hypothetical protein C7974DRAFT_449147 [Boeremia exigua]|uniref:uncharacterized protein n=1 Tax=Boeremia exigua TaxID=749465 RepID=UPI001E8E65CC|nr:uncharacterized protein C7974DRAFT_449147 [Boeremia exigua]KAH6639187.1 hypothetical protein C7974DRAFT_449147 [Boeremia exigua]